MIEFYDNIDVLKIKRGIKKGNVVDGHTAPVVGVAVVDPFKLTKKKI